MQYRIDFVLDAFMSLFWTGTALLPLFVLFTQRPAVAGWTYPEALFVVAFFTILKGVLEGAIQPALTHVVEHVRKGTLDFLLLKPADAQFLVSTARFDPWKGVNILAGAGIFAWALPRVEHRPTALEFASMLLLLVAAISILYSLWIAVVALSFVFVKVDNLSYLFSTMYDAARWPASVFRGVLAIVFTFVIPLALMTTYPALAVLGRLDTKLFVFALAFATCFAWGSRRAWRAAIGRYTSAGG
jgi:ABC-2 type transport system permease protein